MQAVSMIHTKRWNQRPHTEEELRWWIEAYTRGDIPDYQMSAWLMAVCWRGMTAKETSFLTKYMVQSGTVLKWDDILTVDKHSTGGVGDKISLILAPLVVAVRGNVHVPMMAGRGLDHTGGTLDKLESIPGYQTQLSVERFREIVQSVGCSIVSASNDMVLADRKLYALRDVTGTVSSIPLQTASIVSKKIAEGPNSLVLDVKYGRAAFQQTVEDACMLAQSMMSTAEANGVCPTEAFLTRMDHPIGHAVGNWLEVKECNDLLKTGQGANDLIQLVVVEAAQMLQQASPDRTFDELVATVYNTLKEGKTYSKFRDMVKAHGGDVSFLDDPDSYPEAKFKVSDNVKINDIIRREHIHTQLTSMFLLGYYCCSPGWLRGRYRCASRGPHVCLLGRRSNHL
jgi:pyrimidine-nucleoside phosphorylase